MVMITEEEREDASTTPHQSTSDSHHHQPGPSTNRTMVTRSMHGIFKLKRPLSLSTSVTPSPLPRNPKDALSDPN